MNEYLSIYSYIVTKSHPAAQYSLFPPSSLISLLFFCKSRENRSHPIRMPEESLKDFLGDYIHYFYALVL